MAHGVPVVGSRVGGIPEWLPDGDAGYLVEPRDVHGLAEALGRLLEDAPLAAELGRHGREIAARTFSVDVYMNRLERLLEAVSTGSELTTASSLDRQ
jgi:glycosyltransferase involved in cell wall biosynthesis